MLLRFEAGHKGRARIDCTSVGLLSSAAHGDTERTEKQAQTENSWFITVFYCLAFVQFLLSNVRAYGTVRGVFIREDFWFIAVTEELNKCTVLLDADTEDDLEGQVQGLKIVVPPCAQDPATDAREQWQMHHLLRALLAARQLVLPVRLYKREAPDFVLQTDNTRIGVETTEAINPDYVRAQMHPAAQRDDTVVDPSLYKWGTQGRPKSQIREEDGRTQLSGLPWTGDHAWAGFMGDTDTPANDNNYNCTGNATRRAA